MGNNPSIKDIAREIKKKSSEKGLSLAKLAFELGANQIYLLNVLHGRKVSRPLIQRISQVLNIPDLPRVYEEYLRSRRVENKSKKPKSGKTRKPNKGGGS